MSFNISNTTHGFKYLGILSFNQSVFEMIVDDFVFSHVTEKTMTILTLLEDDYILVYWLNFLHKKHCKVNSNREIYKFQFNSNRSLITLRKQNIHIK